MRVTKEILTFPVESNELSYILEIDKEKIFMMIDAGGIVSSYVIRQHSPTIAKFYLFWDILECSFWHHISLKSVDDRDLMTCIVNQLFFSADLTSSEFLEFTKYDFIEIIEFVSATHSSAVKDWPETKKMIFVEYLYSEYKKLVERLNDLYIGKNGLQSN